MVQARQPCRLPAYHVAARLPHWRPRRLSRIQTRAAAPLPRQHPRRTSGIPVAPLPTPLISLPGSGPCPHRLCG